MGMIRRLGTRVHGYLVWAAVFFDKRWDTLGLVEINGFDCLWTWVGYIIWGVLFGHGMWRTSIWMNVIMRKESRRNWLGTF